MLIRSTIAVAVLLLTMMLSAREVLDRVTATVNGHVILQSDWDEEVRFESLMSGRPLQQPTPEARKAALDRLIDQELLREQVPPAEIPPPRPEEVEKQLQALKDDYSRDHGTPLTADVLSNYRLTESSIRAHIESELGQLRIVDARLRPSIQIAPDAVEAYYKEKLLPDLTRSGRQMTLDAAAPQIRELLLQEKMNQMLGTWLESLRSQAQIRMVAPVSSEARGQGQ